MSIRIFTFCDICNPHGIRIINDQNILERRNSDGRSWFEGKADDAAKAGWKIVMQDSIACPKCIEKNMLGLLVAEQQELHEITDELSYQLKQQQ